MQKYTGELTNYPFTIRTQVSHKKGESDKKRIFCEDIFTFDIETTSFFYDVDKKPFLYKPGYDPDYWCGVQSGGLPYLWQFGVNDHYYYGRDFQDFYKLLEDFPENMKIRIFVHNLSFEWNWMDGLTWNKVFAKSPHKPIKASCAEFPNIEFLCTLSLENMSLADWGDTLGIPKLVGFLDYNQMRTPFTSLTDDELAYGQRDLEVMYAGLKRELETYSSVWKLPMTSTGKIRMVCKDLLLCDNAYRNFIKKLVPENPYMYRTSMLVYAGGYTHGNRCFVNRTVYNDDGKHGGHYDYTSSYPFEMVVGKMPMTTWEYVAKKIPDDSRFEDYAYKMHLIFKNLRSELQNTYIPFSHCECVLPVLDNGRVRKAKQCELWCTEQDWQIIKQAYTWESVEVVEMWEARKDYLPKKFVEYVLDLFALKANDPKYKPFVNGLYGMCVTALLQSEVEWNDEDGEWHIHRITEEKVIEHLEKLRRFKDNRYFLNYDWGVWISNGSRARLWNDLIIPYDKHVIYADTDSIFTDIALDVSAYNKTIDERLKKVCDIRGLDFEKTRPFSKKKGKKTPLGQLTIEPEWTEFKTLGAKKYCERWKSDGKLHLTISGVSKDAVSLLKDNIDNFADGFVFDKDEPDVHKLMHTYFDSQPDIIFDDGYVSHQRRGVNLRPNGYKLSLDSSFDDLAKGIMNDSKSESYQNHLRGIWYDDIEELVDMEIERRLG